MFHSEKRHKPTRSNSRRTGWALRWSLFVPLFLTGCGSWDEFRTTNYSFKALFIAEDPLVVLQNDKSSGDQRARALRSLKEPKQNGGSAQDQEKVVVVLKTAATSDTQAWTRLNAIQSLGTFSDPRAVDILYDAYDRAGQFAPETATVIRCQALIALGNTKNPEAVKHLVTVLRAPTLEASSSDQDKEANLQERVHAARALRNFQHYKGTEALVQVLRTEKSVALRSSAHESLQVVTGKTLPADHRVWDEVLHPADQGERAPIASKKSASLGAPILQTGGQQKGR